MTQTYLFSEYGRRTIYFTSPLRMDILGPFRIVVVTYEATVIVHSPATACVLSRLVLSDSLRPHGLQPTRLPPSMGILQARVLEWVTIFFSKGSSQPGIEARDPTLQVGSLPSEPPEKPCTYMQVLVFLEERF